MDMRQKGRMTVAVTVEKPSDPRGPGPGRLDPRVPIQNFNIEAISTYLDM